MYVGDEYAGFLRSRTPSLRRAYRTQRIFPSLRVSGMSRMNSVMSYACVSVCTCDVSVEWMQSQSQAYRATSDFPVLSPMPRSTAPRFFFAFFDAFFHCSESRISIWFSFRWNAASLQRAFFLSWEKKKRTEFIQMLRVGATFFSAFFIHWNSFHVIFSKSSLTFFFCDY